MKLYGSRPPAFEPGTQFAYSNYGFVLLGAIIEAVSGESYYEYVREHIFAPAGMTSTDSLPESVEVPNRSIGYMLLIADSTQMLMTGKPLLERPPGRPSGALTPGVRYGFGFEDARDKDGNGWVGHPGGGPGINGELRIYPKSGYVVAVLANLDWPAASRIADYLDLRLPR